MNKETCKYCLEEITFVDEVWVDKTDGDGCLQEREDGADDVHSPAPEEEPCEGCGHDKSWDYSEKYCERCLGEAEDTLRGQEWDYWHA